MKRNLESKVAIITGGVRGIGRAIATVFAEEGAEVAVFDLEAESSPLVEELRAAICVFGKECFYRKADVTNMVDVYHSVEETVNAIGRVDILVNNAGGGVGPVALEDLEEKVWDWTIDLNLKGTYICTRAVIKYMKAQKSGKIVNISSQAGRSKSELSNLPYASAKAGVLGFTRQLAHEVGPFGINVNAIAPGVVERDSPGRWEELTDEERREKLYAIPLRRRGRREEIAWVAAFLASESSSYITGVTIDVNGGRFMM